MSPLSEQTVVNYRARLRKLYKFLPYLDDVNQAKARKEIANLENKLGCEGPPEIRRRGRPTGSGDQRADLTEEARLKMEADQKRNTQVKDGNVTMDSDEALAKFERRKLIIKKLAKRLNCSEHEVNPALIIQEEQRLYNIMLGVELEDIPLIKKGDKEEDKIDPLTLQVMQMTGKPLDQITPELIEKFKKFLEED